MRVCIWACRLTPLFLRLLLRLSIVSKTYAFREIVLPPAKGFPLILMPPLLELALCPLLL